MKIRKNCRISYNAPVILTFVLLCFAATVLGLLTGHGATKLVFSVYRSPLTDPLTYVRLLGHTLGHGGLDHFAGNAMFLLLLGPMLEEKYGGSMLLKVILFTAVFTGIIHSLLWANVMLCGASGVVFACIILSSFTAFKNGEIPLTFLLVAAIYIGREVFSGVLVQDNVSNLTHILGGIVGGGFGYLLNKK